MDVVLSFDDTGSMSSIRQEVRKKIEDLTTTLFKVIPDLRVGICIHNDYGDIDCYHQFQLTNDPKKISEALNKRVQPGGYGNQAAYELPLHNLHSTFNWESDKKVAIIIGDEVPNKVGMIRGHNNTYEWQAETRACANKNIKIYGVHALGSNRTRPFYETISNLTGGIKLDLAQFAHIAQYITAIAYQEVGRLEEYENSEAQFNTNYAFKNMFNKLKGLVKEDEKLNEKLVTMGRFQMLPVPYSSRIDHFVTSNGIHYVKGRGFYQLKKSETVQEYKEIVMINKATGETIPDQNEARAKLGLPKVGTVTINPKNILACRDYDVYIQSTSYTRKLDPGTNFLYEVARK